MQGCWNWSWHSDDKRARKQDAVRPDSQDEGPHGRLAAARRTHQENLHGGVSGGLMSICGLAFFFMVVKLQV